MIQLKNKVLWDKAANKWKELKLKGGDIFQRKIITKSFISLLGQNLNGKKIIDLGCGEGFYSRLMAKKGANVIGIDISSKQLQNAKSKITNHVQYQETSSTNLSTIENKTIDKVVSIMLFMYLNDKELLDTITEVFRTLKNGGDFIIIVRHPFTTRAKIEENWISRFTAGYFSKKPFYNKINQQILVKYFPRTLSTLCNMLIENGFIISKIDEPIIPKSLYKKDTTRQIEFYKNNPFLLSLKATKK